MMQAKKIVNEVVASGQKLTIAKAHTYDSWFRQATSKWIDDCLERHPGSECCFSCHGSGGGYGWGQAWCHANCFLLDFPGL